MHEEFTIFHNYDSERHFSSYHVKIIADYDMDVCLVKETALDIEHSSFACVKLLWVI